MWCHHHHHSAVFVSVPTTHCTYSLVPPFHSLAWIKPFLTLKGSMWPTISYFYRCTLPLESVHLTQGFQSLWLSYILVASSDNIIIYVCIALYVFKFSKPSFHNSLSTIISKFPLTFLISILYPTDCFPDFLVNGLFSACKYSRC